MPDLVLNTSTTLPPDEVMVRAVQFFTTERWRAQSQSGRIATFVGMPKISFVKIGIALLLTLCFVVPGVIYYIFVISKMRRLQNIVVTATPIDGGCEVVVTYPKHARRLVENFVNALPGATASTVAAATA